MKKSGKSYIVGTTSISGPQTRVSFLRADGELLLNAVPVAQGGLELELRLKRAEVQSLHRYVKKLMAWSQDTAQPAPAALQIDTQRAVIEMSVNHEKMFRLHCGDDRGSLFTIYLIELELPELEDYLEESLRLLSQPPTAVYRPCFGL